MQIRESYKILRLERSADLDDVKRSFRRLAFELHPDLNKDDPNAADRFRLVNEAYVVLKRHLEIDAARQKGRDRAKAKKDEQARKEAEQRASARQKEEAERRYREQEQKRKQEQKKNENKDHYTAAGRRVGGFDPRQEVLGDLLKDPFARQVFEDIYSEVRRASGKAPEKRPAKPPKKKKLQFMWGEKEYNFDLTEGLMHGVKSWFKGQMNDELSVHVAPVNLLPGARIRLQVKQPWSGKSITVDVTVPNNYVAGRSIRLKGLGRKFGPWKGDLFVRLFAK